MPAKATNDTQGIFADVLKPMQSAMLFGPMISPMIKPQVEQFWDAQEKMLDEAEAFTRHWFARRHEAARTALDAARTAASGDDAGPAAAMQALSEWQRHSAERLAEDGQEWLAMIARCASYVSETEVEAVEETLSEAVSMAEKTTATAKSEPV